MSREKEEAEILFEKYQARIESLPVHLQDSVGVLYSVVLSVSANGNNQTTDRVSEINHLQKAELNDFYNNDGKFIKLTDVTSTSFLSNLLRNNEVWKLQKEPLKPFVFPTEDQFQKKLFQIQTILTENSSVDASSSSKENLRGILTEIFEFEYEGRIRLHISRLLADGILPLKSLMSEVERGIKESELLTFTSLSSTDLYRSNQLQEFSELILQKTKALPNFTGTLTAADGEEGSILKRKYFKSLSAFLFAQILSQELQTNPLTLKKYYPMTDELLYCLHWPPPDRRNSKSVWQRTIMNESDSLEPSESEVIDATNKNREVTWETVTMTPAGQMIAMIHRLNQNNRLCWFSAYVNSYLVGVRLISSSQQADSSLLSPASKENLKGSSIEGEHAATSKEEAISSTSVFLFSCESNENIRLLAYRGPVLPKNKKPDKQGTILLSTQFPNELEVQVHSSGDIRIASSINRLLLQSTVAQQRKKQQFYPLFPETSRFISEFGQIVRHYENPRQAPFSHEIYYPDGRRDLFLLFPFYKHTAAQAKSSSLFYNPNTASPLTPSSSSNSKLSTSLEAAVLHKIPSDTLFLRFLLTDAIECYNEQHQLIKTVSANDIIPSETFQEFVDAESKCIVKYYPDGRIITEYVNGLKIVLFPDGTKFLHNEKTKMLTISRHLGYPEIEMDVDVDSTCRKHAQGMEIPINKGGERVRSRISFPDGSAAFIKYDTRVTAKCNGSIKLVRKDRTTILAKDDGTVTFHPSTTWTNEDEEKYLEDCKIDDLDPNDSRIKGRSATTAFPFSALPTSGTNGFGSVAPPPAISRNSNHGTNETLPPALISKRRGSPPTAVRSSRRSPDRSTTTSSRSPVLGAMTGHNVFASNHEPDAVISVNLIRGTCVIKDYEFNSFEIDLAPQPAPAVIPEPSTESVSAEIIEPSLSVATDSVVSPLDVKVELAGEVPGLKPPAVARSPKPPRLYTISRTGEATEVLSIQEVRLFEHQAKINSDVTKYSSPAVLPPNELGPAYSWRYFTEKRYFSSYFHGFSFQEIFGTRYYHSIKIPAATLNFLYTKPTLHYRKENEVGDAEPGRIFESISLIEKLPISQEGYSQITVSIQKCEEFRQQRVLSIDRFAVEDPRPPEQIKEEEEITKRLKQVYKLAKINAAKKKAKGGDDDGDDDVSQANSAVKAPLSARSTGSNQSPSAKEYKPSKGNETIKEGDNEDEDDDQADEDDHFGSDDEDGEPDPEEAAVRAVFDDFSSQSEVEGFLADVIPVASLQEAFVRILNQFISQDLIEKAILDTDEVDVNLEEFTFQEFRLIFVSLQKQLQLSEEQKTFDETSYTPYAVDQYVDENDDSPLRPYSTKGISEDARSFPSSRTRESYFHRENSSNNNTPRNVAKTAPPLNLTGILASAVSKSGGSKTDEDGLPIMDSLFSNESSIAVGQPINAVRRAKTMK